MPITQVRTMLLTKKGVPRRAPRLRIIVNCATLGREPRHESDGATAPWNAMVTVAPCPRTLVKSIVPPQLSTRRRAIASPSPHPRGARAHRGSRPRPARGGGEGGVEPARQRARRDARAVARHGEPPSPVRDP